MLIFRLFMLITWLYTAAISFSGNVRSSLLFTLIQLQAGKISCFLQKSPQCSADFTSSYLDCTLPSRTQLMILIHCNQGCLLKESTILKKPFASDVLLMCYDKRDDCFCAEAQQNPNGIIHSDTFLWLCSDKIFRCSVLLSQHRSSHSSLRGIHSTPVHILLIAVLPPALMVFFFTFCLSLTAPLFSDRMWSQMLQRTM